MSDDVLRRHPGRDGASIAVRDARTRGVQIGIEVLADMLPRSVPLSLIVETVELCLARYTTLAEAIDAAFDQLSATGRSS